MCRSWHASSTVQSRYLPVSVQFRIQWKERSRGDRVETISGPPDRQETSNIDQWLALSGHHSSRLTRPEGSATIGHGPRQNFRVTEHDEFIISIMPKHYKTKRRNFSGEKITRCPGSRPATGVRISPREQLRPSRCTMALAAYSDIRGFSPSTLSTSTRPNSGDACTAWRRMGTWPAPISTRMRSPCSAMR